MATNMSKFEIDRWNSDDEAIYELFEADWKVFWAEPRFGKDGVESRKHKKWRRARQIIHSAIDHLRTHTPEYRQVA